MLIKTGTSSFIQEPPQPSRLQSQIKQPTPVVVQQQIPAPVMIQQQIPPPIMVQQQMAQPMFQPQVVMPIGDNLIQTGMPPQGGMVWTEEHMKLIQSMANMMQNQGAQGNGGMMPSQQSILPNQQFQSFPTMPYMAPPEINHNYRGLTQQQVDMLPKDASQFKTPVKIFCPKCHTVVLTSCEKKWGCGAFICCFSFACVPCGPCWLICCIDYCKDQHHTCPECRQDVGKRTYCCC